MKTAHKIYAALAILAILAGGLYLIATQNNKEKAKHTVTAASADLPSVSLPKDDADKLTKIEVTTIDKDDKSKKLPVTLEKKGDAWEVTSPVEAKANTANVKSLIDNLKDIKTKEVIDPNRSSYDQYDVSDDKAVHVVAWKGADKVDDLYFGKSGTRGQMVRVAGRDGVFIAEKYSGYLYTRELKRWRDGSILNFDDANAIQVDVTNKNGRFSFSKNGDKWSASLEKRDKDGKLGKPEKEWKKFDESKVKDLLRAFKVLNADDFGEAKDLAASGVDKAEENGGVVHIKLKDNAGDLVLKVGKMAKGTTRWAVKGGSDILYAITPWSSDWAIAEPSKFEKSDDKKTPPPVPTNPHAGMQGMNDGVEE